MYDKCLRTPANIIKRSASVTPLTPTCEYRNCNLNMMKTRPMASEVHASMIEFSTGDMIQKMSIYPRVRCARPDCSTGEREKIAVKVLSTCRLLSCSRGVQTHVTRH
jgi:hypothetical protein